MSKKLENQRSLFHLDKDVYYLNNAYMSPNLKSVEMAGIVAIKMKSRPYLITIDDFFKPVKKLKETFAKLVNIQDYERIAIIPSVSYGLASAANNMDVSGKKNIIIPAGQFPSNYYIWERLAINNGLNIKIIDPPHINEQRGRIWNELLLDAIDADTALVACGHVHWADGTKYDLEAIREKCDKVDAYLVIDGSQSIGALPFDVQKVRPDVLVTAGYKWLFGPYGIGFAYYNEKFDDGVPIEENWINRLNSEDFKQLVNYQSVYKPKAHRYCVGESSKFVDVPMMQIALDQILAWEVDRIHEYSRELIGSYLNAFKELGCQLEDETYRGNHLLGIRLPENVDMQMIGDAMKKRNVHISMRGNSIRLATSVYNSKLDMDQFYGVLLDNLRQIG